MVSKAGLVSPVLLLRLLALSVAVAAETAWEAATVAGVVHGTQRPSAVIATLCCPPHKKIHLHAALTKGDGQATMVQFTEPGRTPHFDHDIHDHYIVFVVDLSCNYIEEHLKTSEARKLFRSPFRWILLTGYDNRTLAGHRIPKAVENIDILSDGEVIVVQPLASNTYDVYYIYKTGVGTQWRTESYGTWDAHKKFKMVDQIEKVTALRRINLHKYEISASLVITNNDSLNHLLDGRYDHIDTISKVNYPIIDHLMDYLNASKKFVFSDSWGYYHNGTWTGMSGLLVRDEVEIGGSPIFITKERQQALSLVSSPTPTEMKFVFIQPKLSYTQNLYFLSFSPALWRCLFVLVILLFLALFAAAKAEWRKYNDDEELELKPRTLRGNIADVAMVVIGAVCQQGSPTELKGSLGRVVTMLLFLALMFIYTSYSANIVALLQSSSSQIRTLEDLLNSRMKMGVDDTAYNKYFFSTAKKPIQRAIYQQKISPPGGKPQYFSMKNGVRKIQKGLFAFHMEVGVGYKFVNKYFKEGEKCNLQEINFLQLPMPWQATRKYTPYMEMYKIGFKRVKEAGLQTRQNVRLYDKRPRCSGRESNFISVSMVDCYPALLELAYGVMIALFVLLIEILMYKRERIIEKICCKS